MHNADPADHAADDPAERKRAEFERAWFAAIVDSANDAIISKDLDGVIRSWNKAAEGIFGYSADDAIGQSILMLIPRERHHEEDNILSRIRVGERVEHFETVRLRKDGTRVDISLTVSPVKDARGRVIGASKIARDITEQKRVREELRASEARFRGLAEGMPHLVWETDARGSNYYQNREWYAYIGDRVGSSFGEDWLKYYHPDDREYLRAEWTKSLRTEGAHVYDIEVRIRRHDGVYRWFRVKGAPVRDDAGAVIKWVGTCTDIDDQKRAEQALRESEERFRTLADNIAQFAWTADASGSLDWYNQRWFDYTGTTLEEMRQWGWRKVHHPDHADRVLEKFRRCVESGEVWEDTFPLRGRDGGYRWFLSRAVPIRDDQGRVLRWFGTNTDITDQREAELAVERLNWDLQNSVAELQTLLHAAPIGIGVANDPECSAIYMNTAGARILNVPAGENVSKSLRGTDTPPFRFFQNGRELRPEELPMQFAARENVDVRDVEIDVVWEDGRKRKLLAYASPLRDGQGKVRGCVGILIDITDRRQMEEDLLRAQKLESIGLLAGGIAHDFNNILTAVFGNIELAKLYAEGRTDIVEPLGQAEKAFKRARDLTHQLLTFSRGGAPIRKVTPIGELLQENVAFALHGSNVRTEFKLAPDLLLANVDPGQIGQAINNLVINAKDAMADGGRLRVDARNVRLAEDNPFGLPSGPYIEIGIKDWGIGISDDDLHRLFDPYFTTKPHGTGLGLSTVYSIINRHGGHITVRSKPGIGTTFTVYLPASGESLPAVADLGRTLTPGRGRILLMDDEEGVRQVGKALLTRLGYEVETAADGRDAVALFRAARDSGNPFLAVILDLTIPGGMGGRECLERLRAIDPGVRALVSSGYFNDPVMSDHEAYGFCGVVPKPYQLTDLSDVLSRLSSR